MVGIYLVKGMEPRMGKQTVLLTSHKGVDLHAATASRVMTERLGGGDQLVALFRCEYHTWWEQETDLAMTDVLEVGRYFNPNKHSYGHFEMADSRQVWHRLAICAGQQLAPAWPGDVIDSDLAIAPGKLFDHLLGGNVADNCVAVDICTFPLGEERSLLSGVLWRLVLQKNGSDPIQLADRLVCARGIREGLLVNPHMQGWLMAVRDT